MYFCIYIFLSFYNSEIIITSVPERVKGDSFCKSTLILPSALHRYDRNIKLICIYNLRAWHMRLLFKVTDENQGLWAAGLCILFK